MVGRERFGIKREKGIYTKEWEVKSRNNLVISWYASSRI